MSDQHNTSPEIVAVYELLAGLEIELVNLSRKLAGDRYLFALEARLDIPVADSGLDEPTKALLEKVYGPAVPYAHRYERNFIDENDLKSLTAKMKGEFESSVLPYLKREDITHRILQAKLHELKTKFWKFNLGPEEVAFLA